MPGESSKIDDQYSPEETQQRMKAALLGSRLAGHVSMKAKPKAKKKVQPKQD